MLDRRESHVTTAVRGTVGHRPHAHIAPEYLSTGQSSDKTDVFGFGMLLELVTGLTALEFGESPNQKGSMLDWGAQGSYDRIELEKMLEGDGLAERWEASQRASTTPTSSSCRASPWAAATPTSPTPPPCSSRPSARRRRSDRSR
ncbi:hypothetical protein GUJ93_ZPchr0012g19804 [Zizania palustris]|uniref:Protein kinase domain-containing protein n=1 Tax=Zizania palustris TaxID=103762 RepID=A0A8J6BV24_ZIZPA|nr:hypothetical protein GUJ93_ZPchr0012g19804 [Zizania palustris]